MNPLNRLISQRHVKKSAHNDMTELGGMIIDQIRPHRFDCNMYQRFICHIRHKIVYIRVSDPGCRQTATNV